MVFEEQSIPFVRICYKVADSKTFNKGPSVSELKIAADHFGSIQDQIMGPVPLSYILSLFLFYFETGS